MELDAIKIEPGPQMEGAGNTAVVKVNNSLAVTSKIAKLYSDRLMCDLTLVVNGYEFQTHRLILCASSDVFQAMLMNSNWTESCKDRIELQESSGCLSLFESFLQYFYTGQVILDSANVLNILTLSDKYNVRDLMQLCVEYMKNHIPLAAVLGQLVIWFQYCAISEHDDVANLCKNYIKWNFEAMVNSEDYQLLELDMLISILADNDIVVKDEYTLYTYLNKWVELQTVKFASGELETSMIEIVEHTVSLIRFPMMSPRQLANLLLVPLTLNYKDLIMNQMLVSMKFHAGDSKIIGQMTAYKTHPYHSKLFTPRLYCTDQWSVTFNVDCLSLLNNYLFKTLVFSTPLSFCEKSFCRQMEWVVDFYPKGVCYHKALLIVWQGTLECPAYVLQTVRLSIHCKCEEGEDVRVLISVLIYGKQDGVEHVRSVTRKPYIFSGPDKVLNIDNLLPYSEFIAYTNVVGANIPIRPRLITTRSNATSSFCGEASALWSSQKTKTCYVTGPSGDELKIRIIITPMSEIINLTKGSKLKDDFSASLPELEKSIRFRCHSH